MTKEARRARITKETVTDALPEARRYILWDDRLKGFGIRVEPTGVKTFVARYRAGGGRTGILRQQVIARFGVKTADEARKAAKIVLAAATAGDDPQGVKAAERAEMTVSALCDLYRAEGCATKKAGTLYTDKLRIDRHIKPLLGKRRVSSITQADVERFMQDIAAGKTKSDDAPQTRGGKGTASRTVGMLGGIFSFAVDRKLRRDNPVKGVRRFKDRKMDRFLSAKELAALGDAFASIEADGVDLDALAILRLLTLTGARRGEIEGLRWDAVDIERRCLRLADSKTGAKVIPLGAAALEVLSKVEGRDGSPFVFPHKTDPAKPYGSLERVWAEVCKRAKIPKTRIHDLRHTYASAGLASGQGLFLIGKLLGHADFATTQRYAHLADDPVKAAADAISDQLAGALAGTSAELIRLARARRK